MKRKRSISDETSFIRNKRSLKSKQEKSENMVSINMDSICLTAIKNLLKEAIDQQNLGQIREIISKNSQVSFEKLNISRDNQFSKLELHLLLNEYTNVSNLITNFIQTDESTHKRDESKLLENRTNNLQQEKLRCSSYQVVQELDWNRIFLNNKQNPLHYACKLGHIETVQTLIELRKFDMNAQTNSLERHTALNIACDLGYVEIAEVLVANGADVNYENGLNKTPLIQATELDYPFNVKMCELLLANGAQVNKSTSNGNSTALFSACKYENVELVGLLLKANANVNWSNNAGITALMRASYKNHVNVLCHLIENGAEVEARNLQSETAMYMALVRGHFEVFKVLVEKYHANIDTEDMDGDTALSRACYHNKYVFISYLLRKGAQVNVHGIRGNTPLHISMSSCSVQTIKDLIAHGAFVDALNDNHETALHIACRIKRFEVLKLLLEHARHVDVLTLSNSKTPLFTLIESIDVDCIEMAIYLIKAGADVEKLKEPTKRLSRFANLIQILNQSPFFYLFKIKKSKFIFHQQQSKQLKVKNSNSKLKRRDLEYDIDSPISSLRTYLILIELVIKAGYKVKQMDYQFFRNSWLYCHTHKYNIELRRSLESLFLMNGLNSPRSLIDQCRIQVRLLLAKPIRKSIDSLCIPSLLKNFLQFD